ncbi:recombinase family protein [Amycolatopsis anabasis]|uniref:recombinase family protein n=1 Tax=Amycolatopsis anabasis TaxID=1840409 RepID=UPI00131B0704|nr:recombinase family protein [Amycolatopsis anabasis]
MTAEIISDPWATLDDLLGIEVVDAADEGIGPLAFYGRCSTEDNQDPETSRGWQLGNARKFVEPLGGSVAAEFFDIGQSRSVPWERREAAGRLLAALKDPNRGWDAVVVGEGTRCWFGNQFSLIAPRFAAYGVDLWVPELGGKFDARNPSHKMLMSVLGGMSESERQHVQARVRAAMDAQVINEGRHQGGRAPYGYVVVDGGPHPNPRKAAEGFRLRVLAIDELAAEVVRRIFAAYLDGRGDRAIANELNRLGIPCPSAYKPEQNPHRFADGWQGSTVRSILENPRYTGYAFFGRWTRQEMLLDPDDVAAGHVVRFRRAAADRVVRSRKPAHPKIIEVEDFVEVQLRRRSRAAGGLPAARKLERGPKATKRAYPLRGRVRCGYCLRRMEGTPRETRTYYRCAARSLVPGSPALQGHPKNVYLPEVAVLDPLNDWLGGLFDREHIDRTVDALVASQHQASIAPNAREAAQKRLDAAEAKLRRFKAAIEAGVDPAALVESINDAQAQRAATKAELDGMPAPNTLGRAEVFAMIDSLGDVGCALKHAEPAKLQELYEALRLEMVYDAENRAVDVTIQPARRVSAGVRGGDFGPKTCGPPQIPLPITLFYWRPPKGGCMSGNLSGTRSGGQSRATPMCPGQSEGQSWVRVVAGARRPIGCRYGMGRSGPRTGPGGRLDRPMPPPATSD